MTKKSTRDLTTFYLPSDSVSNPKLIIYYWTVRVRDYKELYKSINHIFSFKLFKLYLVNKVKVTSMPLFLLISLLQNPFTGARWPH